MNRADDPRVVVDDIGVDAAVHDDDGDLILVLRPGQSFENAVAAAQRCLPGAHPDAVRRLVREHLPNAPRMDPPPDHQIDPGDHAGPPPHGWRAMPLSLAVGVLTAAVLVGVAVTAMAYLTVRDAQSSPPVLRVDQNALLSRLADGGARCTPAGPREAECQDPQFGFMQVSQYEGPEGRDAYVLRAGDFTFRVWELTDEAEAEAAAQVFDLDAQQVVPAGRWFVTRVPGAEQLVDRLT